MVHVIAAAVGISAILATSALAFSIVKYVGAAYLVYLGVRALCSAGSSFEIDTTEIPAVSVWRAFRQGVLIDVLNPKVAIFFLAFLPQFVRPELGGASLQILGLGTLVVLVAIIVEFIFVASAARTTRFFRANRTAAAWLDRTLGTILIGLGIRLAMSERHGAI
jgi:threonine/homoserine/homoserine lactone efflux protein